MAVKTKHTFPNAVGTNGQSATVFAGHGIELNNLNDLDVYVTLSGGTRVLQLRQASGSTAQSSHPQVNNTDGLYFPAVSAGTTLYNYQLTTANDTITFNSALPTGAVVTVERRTGDEPSDYTTFAGGSTVRHTDLNRAATESNYTAQEARNKVFEIEGKLFGDAAKDSSFITSADIVDGTIVAADLASNAVTTVKIQDDAVTGDKLNNTGVTAGSYTVSAITVDAQGRLTAASNGSIGSANIAADAIDGSKLADNAVNSEHYVDGSIDAVHLATDAVTSAKIEANAVGSSELATNAVTTVKVAADAINGDKIADDSINSEHYVDGSIDTAHIGNNQITSGKLADDSVVTAKIADNNVTLAKLGSGALPTDITVNADNLVANSVGTSEIAADAINGTKIADNAIGSEHIAANAVTTSELADAELTTLAGMQSGTASILASSTALTSTTAELNLLDGKSISTTISGSSTDNQLPTAKAVNDAVANISDAGNFVPIANEVSFPNSNPDPGNNAGTIVSIADAGGIVVNGSGVSTTGRTLGGATVTINGIDSSLHSTTIAAGKGMLVQTTTTTNTYDYHRLVVDEAGVAAAQTLVSDFNNRYRIGSSNPSSSLDDGDLFFNTTSNKMLVYNDTDSSWDEVQSVGNYFINTISSYSGTGGNNATFNGTAYRFVLSNAGAKAEQHLVSINGVIQKPNSGTSQPSEGFAIDGSSIIFSNAPATGSDYFIITIGSSVNIGTPSNNTVSTATLQNLAVTGDKIANDTITEVKLDIHQAPSDGKFLKYTSSNGMEWGDVPAGVGGATGVDFNDTVKARFGTGNDLEIYHDSNGNSQIYNNTGFLLFNADAGNIDFRFNSGNDHSVDMNRDGAVELYYDNSKKLETTSTGIAVTGRGDFTKADSPALHVGNTDYYFKLGQWASSSSPVIDAIGTNSSLIFGINGSEVGRFVGDDFRLGDSKKLALGASQDLQIYHDGANGNYIKSAVDDRDLYLQSTRDVYISTGDGSTGIHTFLYAADNAGVELRYDNVKKFETTATGIEVPSTSGMSGIVISTTAASDAEIEFINTNSDNRTWAVGLDQSDSKSFVIANNAAVGASLSSSERALVADVNGAVELYYDNVKQFYTTSTGSRAVGQVEFDGGIRLTDTREIQFGDKAGGDLKIYHDGSNSFIQDVGAGRLWVDTNLFQLVNNLGGSTATMIRAIEGGSVDLHYDGTLRMSTGAVGMIVFGATGSGNYCLDVRNASSHGSGNDFIRFKNQNSSVAGGIEHSGSTSVSYNTSSDYRLKENEVAISDGITRLKTLKPYRFNFKSEPARTVDGFFAHEVTAVPEAITGTKDAVAAESNEEEGITKGDPIHQQIDQSKLVPLLTAALQEAITKIETLETKVAALEAK